METPGSNWLQWMQVLGEAINSKNIEHNRVRCCSTRVAELRNNKAFPWGMLLSSRRGSFFMALSVSFCFFVMFPSILISNRSSVFTAKFKSPLSRACKASRNAAGILLKNVLHWRQIHLINLYRCVIKRGLYTW